MSDRGRWEARLRDGAPGAPEPSLVELMPLLPRGLALDVAAGRGRHAIALARAGFCVIPADYASLAMRSLGDLAQTEGLTIFPVVADLENYFPFKSRMFDAIVNLNFLHRGLVPRLKDALRPGGMLLFETFLVDQTARGHPRDPRFLLQHYELREMLSDMELLRYREGLTIYPASPAWRATALARRI